MLVAYRTETLWLRLVILALAVLLILASWAAGSDPWRKPLPPPDAGRAERVGCIDIGSIDFGTDRSEVRRALRRGSLWVVYGTEMNPAERRAFVEMLTSQTDAGMAGPLRDALLPLREELDTILSSGWIPVGDRFLTALSDERLLEALAAADRGPCAMRVDAFVIEIGFAHYRHWKTRPSHELFTLKGETRRQPPDKRVALPDTYQLYVRFLQPR